MEKRRFGFKQKLLGCIGAAALWLSGCASPQPVTVEVTRVVTATSTPRPPDTPTPWMITVVATPTPDDTATPAASSTPTATSTRRPPTGTPTQTATPIASPTPNCGEGRIFVLVYDEKGNVVGDLGCRPLESGNGGAVIPAAPTPPTPHPCPQPPDC